MNEVQAKIARFEKKVIRLDSTILMFRKPAWGNATKLKRALKEREECFQELRMLAQEV